jgi:glycosyltransferase involved in cell wall biosynthesis
MTNRLAHGNLQESYHQPRAEEAFRRVLLREQPDLVHFQHLIHTSAGLVHVAKQMGLPTIVHCHDYWALCPRVQLIRPDGERCEENMGSGCYLCVKEPRLGAIPRIHAFERATGRLLRSLVGCSGWLPSRTLQRKSVEYRHLHERTSIVTGAYEAADLRVSPSRFLRQKYLDSGAFDPHTFLFSDNGMRTDHVEALEKTDRGGVVRFGFVGSLAWYKGGEVMVRAMQLLAELPVELNVYGGFDPASDPHHAELQRLAGENVHFKGRFDNSRLSEVYAEIDVLIVPSVWFENSPITIHEAYLTRTPVVASDIGGMAEFVRDGVDGLQFSAGNHEDLARVLRRFVEEPELLERLSRDWMEIKTIEENARETEYRYRALACVERARANGMLLDCPGVQADRTQGPTEAQGPDLLLLRPGGAAAEYDLHVGYGRDGARIAVRVDLAVFGGEDSVRLGGRVLLDGDEVGRLGPISAGAEDEVHSVRLEASVRNGVAGRAVLRLESALFAGGPEVYLRVKHVQVRAVEECAPDAGSGGMPEEAPA